MIEYTTPLIDREILFGNPVIAGAKISPDGKFISFIKPLDGMMNIWVKPTIRPDLLQVTSGVEIASTSCMYRIKVEMKTIISIH